jgi:RNA 2',3'-cyclic 3'-phosphodiesterase
MRLFLAIELPEEVRHHLTRVRDAVEMFDIDIVDLIRWVEPENWHITLKFLGNVEESRLQELTDALDSVQAKQMELTLSELIYLPPKRGPVRVVACGVGGDDGNLNLLHRGIESACESVGFERERRAYTPHVTIARAPNGNVASQMGCYLRGKTRPGLFPGPSFVVRDFALVQSVLRAEGAEYFSAARFGLGK